MTKDMVNGVFLPCGEQIFLLCDIDDITPTLKVLRLLPIL